MQTKLPFYSPDPHPDRPTRARAGLSVTLRQPATHVPDRPTDPATNEQVEMHAFPADREDPLLPELPIRCRPRSVRATTRPGSSGRRRPLLALLALSLFCSASVSLAGMSSRIPANEYNALVDLYNSTNGSGWTVKTGWLNPAADSWHGVTVSFGHVTGLDLFNNHLTGTIPASIGNLTWLNGLGFYSNNLTGVIPTTIGNLTQLYYLVLGDNNLTGTIPDTLGDLTQLIYLGLEFNNLTGTIPASIANLSNLEELYLSGNNLAGDFPEDIVNLTQLLYLDLGGNSLTGTIPETIGSLTQLLYLDLDTNNLTGAIPEAIGNLTDLYWLDLGGNSLTGSIPGTIGNLANLVDLYLSSNSLTGAIPETIGNLSNLEYLDLSSNSLSGEIPETIGSLSRLFYLYLGSNDLTGSIPASIGGTHLVQFDLSFNSMTITLPESLGNLVDLEILDLSGPFNQLTGEIPASFGNLTRLGYLNFSNLYKSGEGLTGEIPASIGNMGRLVELDLSGNHLTGPIPESIGDLTQLRILNLSNVEFPFEGLTGEIPASIGNLEQLRELDLSGHFLEGPIPNSIGDLTHLRILRISRANDFFINFGLTGEIPASIGSLGDLRELDLSGHNLTGPIPESIGNLANLEILKLSRGDFDDFFRDGLSGRIPASICNLSKLEYLDLSGNRLTGAIPPCIGNLTRLEVLQLSKNRLTGGIPPFLGDLPALRHLLLGGNRLSGAIPDALGNIPTLSRLDISQNCLNVENQSSQALIAALLSRGVRVDWAQREICPTVTVSPEGGVRAVVAVPDSVATPVVQVLAFLDSNENGILSTGEQTVECADVAHDHQNNIVYFTPPSWDEGKWGSLERTLEEGKSVLLTTPGFYGIFDKSLTYTTDVVEGVAAIEEGMKVAITEAVKDQTAQALSRLKDLGTKAGARAEAVLLQVLRRAAPEIPADDRAEITRIIEQMPWVLGDHVNASKPAGEQFFALALPTQYGHSQNVKMPDYAYHVLLTLGTGTLVMNESGEYLEALLFEEIGAPIGGEIILPGDLENAPSGEPFLAIPNPAAAQGWTFEAVVHALDGLQITNLKAQSEPRGTIEQVARKLSAPSITVGGNSVDLEEALLSHIYVNPDVDAELARDSDDLEHSAARAWMITATYRVPLDGSPVMGNEPVKALVARQSYAFTSPIEEFEPAHALISAGIYPQVTFSVSDPLLTGDVPAKAAVTHRLALNPLEGRDLPFVPDEYVAGLFRDRDYPTYWMTSTAPGAPAFCQPVPLWWNMFEFGADNTLSPITHEIIFDTRHGGSYPTPDNIHLHHVRDHWVPSWLTGLVPFHAEAPGSFDGTIHFHWRWGRAYGEHFGNGELLLPNHQQWVMGLARKTFPEDFADFTLAINPASWIERDEKVLLVRCEQEQVVPNHQYHTMTTGLSYGLGAAENVPMLDCTLALGGYQILSRGFGPSFGARTIRASEEFLIGWIGANGFGLSVGYRVPNLAALLDAHLQFFAAQADCMPEAIPAVPETALAAFAEAVPATNFIPVLLPGSRVGQVLPQIVDTAGIEVSFSSAPGSGGFRVAENIFAAGLGYVLQQEVGSAGAPLQADFSAPVRQVRNLPVAVRAIGGTPLVTIDCFLGGALVDSVPAALSVVTGGHFAEATLNLDPGQSFDRLIVTSNDPAKELAVGGFQFTTIVIPPGDFNYDGVVDNNDVEIFLASYTGASGAVAFWAREADLNHDGHVDAIDYASLLPVLETPAPVSAIALESIPPPALDAVVIGTTKSVAVAAVDLAGGTISYLWSSDSGKFDDSASPNPQWTAASLILASVTDVKLTLTIQSSGGGGWTVEFNQPVIDPYGYGIWATGKSLTQATGDFAFDLDADTWGNFEEFAFGTNPWVSDSIPLTLNGNVLVQPGSPIMAVASIPDGVDFGLIFCRRQDLGLGNLTYTAQFSADLVTWEDGRTLPTVVARGGDMEAVKVRYPFFMSDGRKAQFSQVKVNGL